MLSILRGTSWPMLPSKQVPPAQNCVNISNSLQRLCPSADAACLHYRPGSSQSLCLCKSPSELCKKPTFKAKSDLSSRAKQH